MEGRRKINGIDRSKIPQRIYEKMISHIALIQYGAGENIWLPTKSYKMYEACKILGVSVIIEEVVVQESTVRTEAESIAAD